MSIVISGQGQSTVTLSACGEPRVSQGGMRGFPRQALLLLLLATSVPLTALGAGWQHVGEVRRVERLPDGIELVAEPARVRITAFHDGVIRFRLAADGTFATESSWAVVEQPAGGYELALSRCDWCGIWTCNARIGQIQSLLAVQKSASRKERRSNTSVASITVAISPDVTGDSCSKWNERIHHGVLGVQHAQI